MTNRLREIWASGQVALNGWCSIGAPFAAELMAAQGYDALTVDMQHGALDYSSLLPMLQAMRGSGVLPMARVPWLEAGAIMKALDAGAYGIICPMVNTAEEAAAFVSYLRYPPLGQRSFGPTRVAVGAGPGYARTANEAVLAFAMVETAQAMANLDAIVATPGLDGIYVGPADLAFSTSNGALEPGFDREEPELVAMLHRIAAACQSRGICAALHCGTPEYAARAAGWGFGLVTISGDSRLLAGAAAASVRGFRGLVGQAGADGSAAVY